jgi:hypothetical protein
MKMPKPLVVFVFSFEGTDSSTLYGGFAKRLQKAGGLKDCEVLTVALENLLFIVREDGSADVIDSISKKSLDQAALVYMKSKWGLPEEANALANYLFYKGIPFMDTSALGAVMSKISTIMRLWGNGVAVPFSLYSRKHDLLLNLAKEYKDILGEKFILKDAQGAKGKINFLATIDEIPGIFNEYPDIFQKNSRFPFLELYYKNDPRPISTIDENKLLKDKKVEALLLVRYYQIVKLKDFYEELIESANIILN